MRCSASDLTVLLTFAEAHKIRSCSNPAPLRTGNGFHIPQERRMAGSRPSQRISATDNWVDKLGEPLTVESARRANEGPMLAEMLKQLDASEAPAQLVDQLRQFKDVSWKALSSYTHGGLHPLARTLSGFPIQLAIDSLRNSNALVCIAAQLTAILTGDPQRSMPAVRRFHVDFADCIPII